MKKLVAILATAVLCVSSTFAFGLAAGARGFMGTNLEATTFADLGTEFKSWNLDKNFDYGLGAYVNLSILGGLGVEVEANLIKGNVKLSSATEGASDYDNWNIDFPVMLWLNQDIGRFAIGIGAGPNFAISIPTSDWQTAMSNVGAQFKDKQFNVGAVVGLDMKFFFTDHIGMVIGGRYITDFTKTDVPVVVGDVDTGATYPSLEFGRKSIYANLGVEFKFF